MGKRARERERERERIAFGPWVTLNLVSLGTVDAERSAAAVVVVGGRVDLAISWYLEGA